MSRRRRNAPTPMPVLDQIMEGAPIHSIDVTSDRQRALARNDPTSQRILGELAECKRVMLPDMPVLDYNAWDRSLREIELDHSGEIYECGPQFLPFPTMWFEHTIILDPEQMKRTRSNQGLGVPEDIDGGAMSVGVQVKPAPPDLMHHLLSDLDWFTDKAAGCNILSGVVYSPEEGVQIVEVAGMVFYDANGEMLGLYNIATDPQTRGALIGADAELSSNDYVMASMFVPVCRGLGMMNCRNVTLREHTRTAFQPRKARRARKDPLSYSTIVLPDGSGYGYDEAGRPTPTGPSTALHQVRGHFRRYGPDKPLFGKYVCTVWVPHHIRGSAEVGEVKSDYRIDTPEPSK